jgi:hypothetical protein
MKASRAALNEEDDSSLDEQQDEEVQDSITLDTSPRGVLGLNSLVFPLTESQGLLSDLCQIRPTHCQEKIKPW